MCKGRQSCRRISRAEFEAAAASTATGTSRGRDDPVDPADDGDPARVIVIIDGRVYDVTSFLAKHPGGALALANCHGTDASVQFSMYHPDAARKYLAAYCIGELADPPARSCLTGDYFALRDRLCRLGLFEARPWSELAVALRVVCLLAAGVAATLWLPGPSWLRVLVGASLIGGYWQQLAFIGHDLGHSSVTHSRLADHRLGALLGNALLGISIGWWKLNHNTHHLVTNSVVDDPDIQHMPLLAVSDEFFASPPSSYYNVKRQPYIRCLLRVQHLLFYPVMCLARFYLYVRSLEHLLGLNLPRERRYLRLPELLSLACFFVWFPALAWQLPDWQHRLAYVLLCHAVSGVLHVQICISHFPMAVCDYKSGVGTAESDDCGHFIASQVASTMDVDCHPWMDWFHGGLQFQLEHHLFPRIPRQHLRAAVPHVRDFCARHDLAYTSLSFLGANAALYTRLKDVASRAGEWRPSSD